MIISIVKGLWTALKSPKLILLLWAWNLLLALAAVWPARAWFGAALDARVETGALLTGFNLGAFADISKYHEIGPFSFLMASMLGGGLVAIAGNAFVNGGILETVGGSDNARTFMHRFFRGGGRFFWRFVRLCVFAVVSGAVVVGIVAALMGAITTPLSNSEWEPAGMFWGAVSLAVAGLAALWFVLALDYARIRVARDGTRGMFRAYGGALAFVARHVFATYGIAVLGLAALAALLLAYVAHETVWTASTWAAIVVLIAVQQVIVFARVGVRVAQVSAEQHYFASASPVAAPAPAPEPAPVREAVEASDVRLKPDAATMADET